MKQITNNILMIRPVQFRYNEETAANNYYQKVLANLTSEKVQEYALNEFNSLVKKLQDIGVNVIVVEDNTDADTPDSIFPNNWISFHNNGMVGLYPMFAKNRRRERRQDILDILVNKYDFTIEGIKDFTELESHNKFLEGTGSMVLDRENKICYAAISIRTNELAVTQFCNEFGYRSVCFIANQDVDGKRMPIYHTNVIMCVASTFVVICLDAIDDPIEREDLIDNFKKTDKEIIEITEVQKHRFAGNMLQVMGNKPHMIMSNSAFTSLTLEQRNLIEKHGPILQGSLDTIESCGGGSARCMIAEIFLPKQKE